jgi:hypothetical protein
MSAQFEMIEPDLVVRKMDSGLHPPLGSVSRLSDEPVFVFERRHTSMTSSPLRARWVCRLRDRAVMIRTPASTTS